jgi:hypothetical protein
LAAADLPDGVYLYKVAHPDLPKFVSLRFALILTIRGDQWGRESGGEKNEQN